LRMRVSSSTTRRCGASSESVVSSSAAMASFDPVPFQFDYIGPKIGIDFLESTMRRFNKLEQPLCVRMDARRSMTQHASPDIILFGMRHVHSLPEGAHFYTST